MKISWLDISQKVKCELNQLEEEGKNVAAFRDEWIKLESAKDDVKNFTELANELYMRIANANSNSSNSVEEPTDWNDIVAQSNYGAVRKTQRNSETAADKILGGWFGRSAGCLLGKPIEKTQRAGIKELLHSNNTWPLTNYITGIGIPDSLLQKYPWNKHSGKESLRENLVCMTEDDDLNYTMINLIVCEKYGLSFSAENVIETWLDMLPVLSTFTAERVAYVNSLTGLTPPFTAMVNNPYREWIGAQIRADIWGWIAPGDPEKAAEYAFRDASVSHVRNGIYSEMFIASLIAASFNSSSIEEIINEALKCIPQKSRLAEAVKFVMKLPVNEQSWEETLDTLYHNFGKYHWVHSINNTALVVASLISSNGDFETAICNAVMGGWDTDCNGATVGSILGTMHGAKNLPGKWIDPLQNKIRSSLKGFDNSSISHLAERTLKIVSK